MTNPYSAIGQKGQDAPYELGYDGHVLKPGEVDTSNPYKPNYNSTHRASDVTYSNYQPDVIASSSQNIRNYAGHLINQAIGSVLGNQDDGNSSGTSNNNSDSSSPSRSSTDPNAAASTNPNPNPTSAIDVVKFFKDNGLILSPEQQAALSQKYAEQANNLQLNTQLRSVQQLAPYANEAQNQNTQRNLIINSQRFAADNTANQLNNLQQARNTAQAGISNAFNTTASMYR